MVAPAVPRSPSLTPSGVSRCSSSPAPPPRTTATASPAATCSASAARASSGCRLGQLFALQKAARRAQGERRRHEGGPGFGKAKSVIFIYLQGGPSHLDLWDPKDNVPGQGEERLQADQHRSCPACRSPRLLPKIAKVLDKTTLIRSMSYTPNGLFNHTAAIYQMHTGYTTDKVSPSGQLEPPSPKDFPTLGSNIIKFKPPTVPMLPFVMMPRPLQESNVVGKGGTAGLPGQGLRPVPALPARRRHGHGQDGPHPHRRPEAPRGTDAQPHGAPGHASARPISKGMPDLEQAVAKYDLDEYYGKALGLVVSGRAKKAFDLTKEKPDDPRALRQEHLRPVLLAGPPAGRGRHARSSRSCWPKVANSDNHSWDVHAGLSTRMKNQSAPMLDAGLSALIERPGPARPA